jgi:hypothetical protein
MNPYPQPYSQPQPNNFGPSPVIVSNKWFIHSIHKLFFIFFRILTENSFNKNIFIIIRNSYWKAISLYSNKLCMIHQIFSILLCSFKIRNSIIFIFRFYFFCLKY